MSEQAKKDGKVKVISEKETVKKVEIDGQEVKAGEEGKETVVKVKGSIPQDKAILNVYAQNRRTERRNR